jgi:hypothetical protein
VGTDPADAPAARAWLDRLGIGASSLCAVHCVALAVLAGGLPSGAELVGEAVELPLLVAALGIAGLALVPGYRRHRWPLPLALASLGAASLLASRMPGLPGGVELGASLTGAASFIAAHLGNLRAQRACAECAAGAGPAPAPEQRRGRLTGSP